MKKIIPLIVIFISTVCISMASSDAETQSRRAIRSLVKQYRLSNATISIAAQNIDSGRLVYRYAEDRLMIPASNEKIFTAIAALTVLPKTFKFETEVLYNKSKYSNGVLDDNLYIDFSGDPSLTGAQIYQLLLKIKQYGINKVTGNIIIVANKFSGDYIPDGWSKSDAKYCYAAPASTLNMNKNCSVIKLIKKPGSSHTTVENISNTSNIAIKNEATVQSSHGGKKCTFRIHMNDDNVLYLSGCLPEQKEFYLNLAIANPALKTLDTIKDFIQKIGITCAGNIIIGNLPKTPLNQLTSIYSEPIGELITHMLHKSDNLYAESIARTVGYKIDGIGSTEISVKAMKNTIAKYYKLKTTGRLVMKDGSGLSHGNYVTPAFMVELLSGVYQSAIGKAFYSYLPTRNIKGLAGKVRAKTGTLKGVSTLSGYLYTKKNHIISFSIMLNNLDNNQRTKARILQNKVLKVFYKYL